MKPKSQKHKFKKKKKEKGERREWRRVPGRKKERREAHKIEGGSKKDRLFAVQNPPGRTKTSKGPLGQNGKGTMLHGQGHFSQTCTTTSRTCGLIYPSIYKHHPLQMLPRGLHSVHMSAFICIHSLWPRCWQARLHTK